MPKQVLGRGLGALLGGVASISKSNSPDAAPKDNPFGSASQSLPVSRLALTQIQPCSFQPRKDFTEESLRELADSIKTQGVVQPLIVRSRGTHYELIAGERRWRAAQLAGLKEVPVVVREADDRTVLELALIENLQRENLNPIEEALGYSQLAEQFQLKQEEIAHRVGKNRATVANALRLLQLQPEIRDYVRTSRLSVGHAKVILALSGAEDQKVAAEKIIRDSLSVRQTEELISAMQKGGGRASGTGKPALNTSDPHISAMQNRLQERLGTKVLLKYRAGKGSVEIRFFNDSDLERVLEILGVKPE